MDWSKLFSTASKMVNAVDIQNKKDEIKAIAESEDYTDEQKEQYIREILNSMDINNATDILNSISDALNNQ